MLIKVNTDKEHVEKIRSALKENENYCPCAIDKSEETKCMCKDFLEMENSGWCHCKLYHKTV